MVSCMPTVLESLNSALHRAFSDNENVYVVGEDVLDPYGGAFKVTRGLSTQYPQRVIATPISEAGFVGLATGMALRGLRPVVEIMFGDFVGLIADQLINHIAKFHWMYNEQVNVPMVIRTPMGGRRGYGPTHSQTLEKHFLGIPHLKVIAPAAFSSPEGLGDPGSLLFHAILESEEPVLFIENKLQYLLSVQTQSDLKDFILTQEGDIKFSKYPSYHMSIRGAPPANLTIAAYGYMAELAKQAVLRLAYEHEIFAELVIPTQLSPFTTSPILDSASRSRSLLVVEEGTYTLGWGAEVVARVAEASHAHPIRCMRLAAGEVPIPASRPLEAQVLPDVDDIIQAATQIFRLTREHKIQV
jgi:pyruvate/2-oxoglutarate/acetoin dehydrogenase E1 component